jgi:RHS repeat-associated protein
VAGTTTANCEYGPFGETIRATGPLAKANPVRFSTKYQEEETGSLYYGYRTYNPTTGRWLSRDRIAEAGGLNLNALGSNDSVNEFDVLGEYTPEQAYVILALQAIERDNRDLALFEVSGMSSGLRQLRSIASSIDVRINPRRVGSGTDALYVVGNHIMYIRNSTPSRSTVMHELVHGYNDIKKTGFSRPIRTDEGTAYAADAVLSAVEFFGGQLERYLKSTSDSCPRIREKLRIRWQSLWGLFGNPANFKVAVNEAESRMLPSDFTNLKSALGMHYKCSAFARVINKAIPARCGCFLVGCAQAGKNPDVIPAGHPIDEVLR